MFSKLFVLALLAVGATAAAETADKYKKLLEKPDLDLVKEDIIDTIEAKINSTKIMIKEAEHAVKDKSLKADAMDKITEKIKAVNLTKIKALKEYDLKHEALPKVNLTLAKPVLKLSFAKPNKTAAVMEIKHMIVKGAN